MPTLRPDPTFYPSARQAAEAPPEELAYLAMLSPKASRPDAIGVVDVDPGSRSFGRLVGQLDMPNAGDELHHFGWNACSASLCPWAPHPHLERRYLVVPGINSSRIHILDTKADPRRPELVKVIEPETVAKKTGYASPHTVHCGPDGIYLSALGAPGRRRARRPLRARPRHLRAPARAGSGSAARSSWPTTSPGTWATTPRSPASGARRTWCAAGVNPELLLGGKYGNSLHVWDLRKGTHLQQLPLGDEYQMTLELRPARDPRKAYGFVGVVISLKDLSASVWLWHLEGGNGKGGGEWKVKKVIEIPAEPADPADLPPLLQGFKAVPPLITDINLSLDDRQLYVSCWGTGELRQYDVSDPFAPRLTATTQIGGIVRRAAHPGGRTSSSTAGPRWWS